jgi:hypothetical protein
MIRLIAAAAAALALAGCAADLRDIDVTKSAPACARECTANYSHCATGGPVIGSKAETLNACKEALRLCVQTCPAAAGS